MKIVHYPHPTLRYNSATVRQVDAELKKICAEMFDLMYEANGIGLAANQVDLPLRLFVCNVAGKPDEGEEFVFINPVVSRPKGNEEKEEGCLSLPGVYGAVRRPETITFQAYTLDGQEFKQELSGMFARVVQHELDHLNGVLFTDRMTETGKLAVRPELDEFEYDYELRLRNGELPDDDAVVQRLKEIEAKYC
ncbi:MAG: peptide deformylase [Pirellulaceae bacterium]